MQNAGSIRKATLMAICLVMAFSPSPIKAFQQLKGTAHTPSKSPSSLSSDFVQSENDSRSPHITNSIGMNSEFTQPNGGILSNASSVMESADDLSSIVDKVMDSYWGPRILLASIACFYGTNFPLGSMMEHAMPASAASSGRFLLASLALSPFLPRIDKDIIGPSLLAGCFTATGYVAQSMALVDTSPATVSFLGCAAVIWCPFLEWLIDKKPMSIADRPQTWLAGVLCIAGVGILELCGGNGASCVNFGNGDALALLQAICFATGVFMAEKMVSQRPEQALPVTSVMLATTAFISMIWALTDGWMYSTPGWESMTLPGLFFEPSMREVAFAVVWTGIASTSLSVFLENFSLRKVPSTEAMVILSTEPLWAAGFASILLGESFGWNDYLGGALIVSACLVNCLTQSDFQGLLPQEDNNKAQ